MKIYEIDLHAGVKTITNMTHKKLNALNNTVQCTVNKSNIDK